MEYWTIALATLGALAVYYYAFRRTTNVFQQHGIPYMKLSTLLRFWKMFVTPKSIAEHLVDMYNVHPDAKYIGIFDFSGPVMVIRDLDLIKSIGIKNFDSFENHLFFGTSNQDPLFGNNLIALRGDKWRDVRALLSPAFTSSKMKAMYDLMAKVAVNFSEHLLNVPAGKRVMEMRDIFTRYANDVIATCAFGIGVDSMRDPTNEFYMYGKTVSEFGTSVSALVKILLSQHAPALARLLGLRLMDDRSEGFFVNLVAETIRTRDENGITRPDMLQLMMDSRGKREPGRELTMVEMTSQAVIFLLGGFDSASTLMSFAAHELAVNPDVQARLQEEIDGVWRDTNGEPSYEAINGMAYMSAVINETLRIFPSQPMTDRLCSKDFELPPALPGAKPYVVRAGSLVWIPFYPLQHDARYFPEPDAYRPERFLDENKGEQCNPNAYYPFGLGPRMCIGNRFALLETKILLFHLLARCDLRPCEKTIVPLRLKKGGFSMRSEDDFWLSIVPRENRPSAITSAREDR